MKRIIVFAVAVIALMGWFMVATPTTRAMQPHACVVGKWDRSVISSPDRSTIDWEVLSTCGYPWAQTRSTCRNAQVQTTNIVSMRTNTLEQVREAVCTSTYPQIIAAASRQCQVSAGGTCTAWVTWWRL
jgi:hypothetical protein